MSDATKQYIFNADNHARVAGSIFLAIHDFIARRDMASLDPTVWLGALFADNKFFGKGASVTAAKQALTMALQEYQQANPQPSYAPRHADPTTAQHDRSYGDYI